MFKTLHSFATQLGFREKEQRRITNWKPNVDFLKVNHNFEAAGNDFKRILALN